MRAVEEVSFTVGPGEVVGIAGPNGAGKSTLIALLLGLLGPDAGEVTVDGLAPRAFIEREGVAYLPELMTIPLEWHLEEALTRLATLQGIPAGARAAAVAQAIEATGIAEHRGKRLKALSKGNLQRLGLAQALLSPRRVVVFDEPTHGLDPVWTARFREIVGGLRAPDRAVLVASHNLDELERIADRVVIVDRGRVQRIVEVRAAQADGAVRAWRIQAATGHEALLAHLPEAARRGALVDCRADVAALNRGLAAAIAEGALVTAVVPAESVLEEAFRTAVSG